MTLILVEGKDDKEFISYLLKIVLRISDDMYDILENGSYGINTDKAVKIRKSLDNGTNFIIINDADSSFIDRQKELEAAMLSEDIKGNIFLFPNNKDNGTLEDLLFMCALDDKKYILDCYTSMIKCLEQNPDSKNLDIPDKHSQAYVYADVNLSKNEKSKRNKKHDDKDKIHPYAFYRKDLWDFDCLKIQPLLDFSRNNIR